MTVLLGGLSWLFVSTPPKNLARLIQVSIPGALIGIGALLVLIGRAPIGLPIGGLGVVLWMHWRQTRPLGGGAKRVSTVRSAALEMQLDLDTGDMEGRILAGALEGSLLSALTEAELSAFYATLAADAESCALLEAYLDRRMPGWREDADTHGTKGHGSPSRSGAMTKQEAYEILGLDPGASPAEIRKAWRKLMKSVHPDSGGTAFLAAKINEAKDVLLG